MRRKDMGARPIRLGPGEQCPSHRYPSALPPGCLVMSNVLSCPRLLWPRHNRAPRAVIERRKGMHLFDRALEGLQRARSSLERTATRKASDCECRGDGSRKRMADHEDDRDERLGGRHSLLRTSASPAQRGRGGHYLKTTMGGRSRLLRAVSMPAPRLRTRCSWKRVQTVKAG